MNGLTQRIVRAVPLVVMLALVSTRISEGETQTGTKPVFAPIHRMTAQDENLLGDPAVSGKPFVVRIRELPGTIAAPHTHTFDENITVLHGTWYFGIGDRFDRAKLRKMPAGSFIFIPRGTPMFGYAPQSVTVQVHGIGPFTQRFTLPLVTLAPIPGERGVRTSPASFHFRAGQNVRSPRGTGRVRQGYATNGIVEYEIVSPSGQVYMAQENELKR